jgi:arylsulfatase
LLTNSQVVSFITGEITSLALSIFGEIMMKLLSQNLTRMSGLLLCAIALSIVSSTAALGANKPNIVVIWGDDIGRSNVSAYTHGLMGYKTPNIDHLAKEGAIFTDYYAENSCTAGRAATLLSETA